MLVYLSNPYGTIPGEAWREYRFYLLAKILIEEGHEVVWFTSTFSHHFKIQRSQSSKVIQVDSNLKIHLIKSPDYKNNFSIKRLIRDFIYGVNLFKILQNEYKKPDIFIIGDSPLTFYFPSYQFCRRNKVPYIIDQMDLWPELIVEALPKKIKQLANIIFIAHYKFRIKVYDNAAGFISLAKKYFEIPLTYSSNLGLVPNAIIYNGINVEEFRNIDRTKIHEFEKILPSKLDGDIWFIFAGTLGPSYDLNTILIAFNAIKNEKRLKLIIAGDGSERPYLENFIKSSSNENIIFLGKLNKDQLAKIYSKCDVGLNAYGPYSNVEMSDKFYDYTAAGLAIINSLTGEVGSIIELNNIGINYEASNLTSLQNALTIYKDNFELLSKHKLNSYKIASFYDQSSQLELFKIFFKNFE